MIRAEPCFLCGSRPTCRHRAVEDVLMPTIEASRRGMGNLNSPWGKRGNPSGKARQRIIDAMKAQLK